MSFDLEAIRCFVFDIDDTLYLERDYVKSGFRHLGNTIGAELGIPDFFDRAWQLFEQGARGDIFNRVLEAASVEPTADRIMALVTAYREHEPDIELLPDARVALDTAAHRGSVAVITDGPLASQQAKARALGLEHWTDHIIYTAAYGPGFGKPHPRAFRDVEHKTGASGRECVYFADNPTKDFAAPCDLGWQAVRIRRAAGLHPNLASPRGISMEWPGLGPLLGVQVPHP